MSDISEMNEAIRKRGAFWGVAMSLVGLLAIAPQAVLGLFQGDVTKKLWWSALVGGAMAAALLAEGLEIGRHPRHRGEVNLRIARGVVRQVCTNPKCPHKTEPTDPVRDSAISLFYKAIDSPSRQVAFHNWGWYYFSALAMWMAIAAFVVSLVGLRFSTDRDGVRMIAYAALIGAAVLMWRTRELWERKNLHLVDQQLTQISGSLGSKLPNALCGEPGCPAT